MLIDLNHDLLPPPELVKDGSASMQAYINVGEHFRRLFEEHLPLRADMRVLEMGSAIGRIARQFIPLLAEQGAFTGIEIMPAQVAWCNAHIAARFTNFKFIHADIYNAEYNPSGTLKASAYLFPFADNELDLVVLTSVFTHMLRQDVAHYLTEIKRVLKPGGFCFASFFTYTREEFSRIFTEDANPRFLFPIYKKGPLPLVMCADSEYLEEAIAYEKDFLYTMYAQSGLKPHKELPGTWLKRPQGGVSYQDVLIAQKDAE